MKKLLSKLTIGAVPWIFAPGVIFVEAIADFGYNIARMLGVIRDLAYDVFVVVTISIPPALVILFILWLCEKY